MRKATLIYAWLLSLIALTGCDPKPSSDAHRFSTLFIAQDVRDALTSSSGLNDAVAWCKTNGISHVYLEAFRDNYQANKDTLVRARDRFRSEGIDVSGCVTTTQIGKPSTGWGPLAQCYTDLPTQSKLQNIFEYTAGIFDEIMIDDFFLEDCRCEQCDKERLAKTVIVGDKSYPISDDSWTNYQCSLMFHLSQDRVLTASKKVNPNVKIIIKYPQWYDAYQDRGYDVARETAAYDKIWVGTETRDWTNEYRWGGTVQYEGYFLMRWLGEIGGEKAGGGWYDWLGTTPPYYIEQARQTVLAGAKESLLFCYAGLNPDAGTKLPDSVPFPTQTGRADIAALRTNMAELKKVSAEVQKRKPIGVAAYKPINSRGGPEDRIYDYIGMIGLPLVPCHEFPTNAPAAFFSLHSYHDPEFLTKLNTYINSGHQVLMTKKLASLCTSINLEVKNVLVLTFPDRLDYMCFQEQQVLDPIRAKMLAPLNVSFQAPDMVGLYLFEPNGWVIENFNATAVNVALNGKWMRIEPREWVYKWE
jgi:hypothetical protein